MARRRTRHRGVNGKSPVPTAVFMGVGAFLVWLYYRNQAGPALPPLITSSVPGSSQYAPGVLDDVYL